VHHQFCLIEPFLHTPVLGPALFIQRTQRALSTEPYKGTGKSLRIYISSPQMPEPGRRVEHCPAMQDPLVVKEDALSRLHAAL
jgi:hypothetical protein